MKKNKQVKPVRLKKLLKTPGMQLALKKRNMYRKRFNYFWIFEKTDIVYLIICGIFYILKVLSKAGMIGNIMALLAGVGTGLIFLNIPFILVFKNRYKLWQKRVNNILANNHFNSFLNKV